jgi:hypothetical protein
MFTNYSQTYAAAIVTFAGLVTTLLAAFNITFIGSQDVEFILGLVVNLVGIIWTITHRNKQGDVTILGFRKV